MMRKNYIYGISLLMFILFSMTMKAQIKHEFSVSAGGGLSTLNYKTNLGERKSALGGNLGLGYTYFLSNKIGIGTGAELSLYKAAYQLDGIDNVIKGIKDEPNLPFDLHSSITNFEEKQNALFLQIPLMIQYQGGSAESKKQFYASAGAKIGFPMRSTYSLNKAAFANKGYFTDANNWVEEPEFMGFGTFSDRKSEGDIKLKTNYLISAETGVKWRLKQNMHLYTGVYIDYGLNDISKKEATQNLIAYNPKEGDNFTTNSVMNSTVSDNNAKATAITDGKINAMAVGVKFRLSFGKVSKAKTEAVIEVPPIIEEPKTEPKQEPKESPKTEEQPIVKTPKEEPKEQPKKEETKKTDATNSQMKGLTISGFSLNESKLSQSHKDELDRLAQSVKGTTTVKIECTGYTCDLGTEGLNQKVGLRRAQSVKIYLVSKGIKASNIQIGSKGESNPIISNDSDTHQRQNRRVEIVVKN